MTTQLRDAIVGIGPRQKNAALDLVFQRNYLRLFSKNLVITADMTSRLLGLIGLITTGAMTPITWCLVADGAMWGSRDYARWSGLNSA